MEGSGGGAGGGGGGGEEEWKGQGVRGWRRGERRGGVGWARRLVVGGSVMIDGDLFWGRRGVVGGGRDSMGAFGGE